MPRVSINADKYRQYDTGQLIRGYMRRANKTQEDMGEALGISRQAYSKKLLNLSFTLRDIQIIVPELGLSTEEATGLIFGKEQV